MTHGEARRPSHVWWFALGYFVCYVPYSGLTKALSSGQLGPAISGVALLPLTTLTSALAMFVTITALRWWKYANHISIGRIRVPSPTRYTFLSGLTVALIVATTTLAYTFRGVSIPLVMLLMRGGVLLWAPIVDKLNHRRVRWYSWTALVLSGVALADALVDLRNGDFPLLCALDVALYLVAYFVRLRLMSRFAKNDDPDTMRRFFVEEQMVATPLAVVFLAAAALLGEHTAFTHELAHGYTTVLQHPAIGWVILVGLLSQGTGVFGGLVLLDARENTFCIPLNRSSSVLAGFVASIVLALAVGDPFPTGYQITSATLLLAAILLLWAAPSFQKRRDQARAREAQR